MGWGSDQAGLSNETRQSGLGTGADVANDFGSAQATDPAAGGEWQTVGQAIEKTAGVEIARSGGVDDPCDRRRCDPMLLAVGEDDAAGGAASQGRDRHMATHCRSRRDKAIGLVKRADLDL